MKSIRERKGWTVYEAAQEMGIHTHTVTTLEGDNPVRKFRGSHIQLRTVIAVIATYWPRIKLDDFIDSEFSIELKGE